MKTTEEIINQEPVFLCDFGSEYEVFIQFAFNDRWDRTEEDVRKEFEGVKVLFAYYSYENYSGYAWVLFEKNGKLYETSGSHCSCYGLEGQWSEEEVDLVELEHRLNEGTFGRDYCWRDEYVNLFAYELKEFLGVKINKKDNESVAEEILGWLN